MPAFVKESRVQSASHMRPLAFRAGIGHEKQNVARLDATDILKYPTQSTPQHSVSLNEKLKTLRHWRKGQARRPSFKTAEHRRSRANHCLNDGEAGKFYQNFSLLCATELQLSTTHSHRNNFLHLNAGKGV